MSFAGREASSQDRLTLFRLENACDYTRWKALLQRYLFKKIRNINMDKLTAADTLDPEYFKKNQPAEFKAAGRDASNSVVFPFTNAAFLKDCLDHCLQTGGGYHDWVYVVQADVHSALSDKIQNQISGVPMGDLVGLFQKIKIAVLFHETRNVDALDIEYCQMTMEKEGKNDLMTFTAVLTQYMRRLDAAGAPVADSKAQRVLLNGLNQEVFENFIYQAKRQPYTDYYGLQQALEDLASEPRTLSKLAALKPGLAQSVFTASTQRQPSQEDAFLTRLEAIVVTTLAKASGGRAAGRKGRCFNFGRGLCRFGDACRFGHVAGDDGRGNANGSPPVNSAAAAASSGSGGPQWCDFHKSNTHTTADCRDRRRPGQPRQQRVNTTTAVNHPAGPLPSFPGILGSSLEQVPAGNDYLGYDFSHYSHVMVTVVHQHVCAVQQAPKIDRWCVDGASTTHGTWDRKICFNVRPCNVTILGPNCKDSFECKEMGDTTVVVYDRVKARRILVTNVLISDAFPFHIFSEILAFDTGCTATKARNSWQFFTPAQALMFHASQSLLRDGTRLYFIDVQVAPGDTIAGPGDQLASSDAQVTVASALSVPTAKISTAKNLQMPVELHQLASSDAQVTVASASSVPTAKVSTAKNLQMLVELHLAHDHWNFEDVAAQYGLTVPSPRPDCWACLLAKPRAITRDTVSTRQVTRVFEGFAADAKGPNNTPTPEGFLYFFLIVCLFSHRYWAILAKSQADWAVIWPIFVRRIEAKSGKDRCVSFIITDGHKVHTQALIRDFNDDRGIEGITSAPYSQWQDPAERGIQTVSNGARASLIHGGGKEWMWGAAVLHATDGINRTRPPVTIPGHEGKTRLRITDPAVTPAKEMRTQKPFLCLFMKSKPAPERGSDFEPRSEPCVYQYYDRAKKAYRLLTIPNLYLAWSIEGRFVTGVFPLRVTNYLANQLDTFLRPTVEDDLYANIHGPANILRRSRVTPPVDSASLVQPTPALVHRPTTAPGGLGVSSTRGYNPSVAALDNLAYVAVADTQERVREYTPDELAARTPKGIHHALGGPDANYWLPSILKDFAILRNNKCIVNITDVRPPGPAPPPVEQRFKIKYRGEKPIALAKLPEKDWKTRTIARGDRFKFGEHFDATAAPVAHTPAVKLLLAWAVAEGLLLFQWDEGHAFYTNNIDREGIIVKLPPGYDPYFPVLRPLCLPPQYGELAKGVPGIPQGSLLHYRGLCPVLRELSFEPVDADNCLFMHGSDKMGATLHVDDGILAAPSYTHAVQFFGPSGLGAGRTITWGPLRTSLGIEFTVDYTAERRLVFMNQRPYAITILERAGMLTCNPARTPATPGRAYTSADCPSTDEQRSELADKGMTKERYHMLVASLNFLMCQTRDDLRFVQGKNAKYCRNPGLLNHQDLARVLRFLRGTVDYGVSFVWRASDPPPADGPLTIEAWSDSSFADDVDTGRTTIGYVVKVNGATVVASSTLSSRVDSCVNHSELNAFSAVSVEPRGCTDSNPGACTDSASIAMVKASRTLVWLRGIKAALERRDVDKMPPTPVYVDNAGVISMLRDATLKSANKHIYRTLAENRERVHLDKSVVAVKIPTGENLANAMTKQEHGVDASASQLRHIAGPAPSG